MSPLTRKVALAFIVLIAIPALIAGSWHFDLFHVRSGEPFGSVAAAFDQPPPHPGYVWTRNGQAVSSLELTTFAGPDHCNWESATFMFIGWPQGTIATQGDMARQYIRDPRGVADYHLREPLIRDATLPADAKATGYRYGSIEIFISPTEQDRAIYVVAPAGAERWPRSDPMTLCM